MVAGVYGTLCVLLSLSFILQGLVVVVVLVTLCGVQGLSSPTRDSPGVPYGGSSECQLLDPQGSP